MAKSKTIKSSKLEMPDFIAPMLATLTDQPFDLPGWVYEIKYDGYRTIARIEGNRVNLLSRNNLSFDDVFRPITKALTFLGFDCILDGEICILDKDGKPDFNALQNYQKTRKGALVFFIFDLLFFQGNDLTDMPLINRRKILESLPLPTGEQIQLSKCSSENGIDLFNAAKSMNLEGIIAKKANSKYSSGRSTEWLKIKNTNACEAVIIGYTVSPRKVHFASIILGYFDKGKLIYIGHAGTGFSHTIEKELYDAFQPIRRLEASIKDLPPKYKNSVVWLQPKLVCRIQFAEMTPDGKVRHCSFKGIIEKAAQEITAIC